MRGTLNPVVLPLLSAMIAIDCKGLNRLGLAAQLLSYHDPRLPELRHQCAKEPPDSFGITAGLNQDAEYVSIALNCPPEPVFHTANTDHGLIQITFAVWPWPFPTNAAREMPAKPHRK